MEGELAFEYFGMGLMVHRKEEHKENSSPFGSAWGQALGRVLGCKGEGQGVSIGGVLAGGCWGFIGMKGNLMRKGVFG